MKRKVLSLITALCLLFCLLPAAALAEEGAAPERLTRIITEEEVLNDLAQQPMPLGDPIEKEADGNYHIRSLEDFAGITQAMWLSGSTFIVEKNLDFSTYATYGTVPGEWGGYIRYFRGTLKGANPAIEISGLKNNTYLIYGMTGGTIQDLTLKFKGEATGLIACGATYGDKVQTVIRNVTTTGYVNLTADDQSNYSPYIFCGPHGGLLMENCTNTANISGNVYASIFHGYYPLCMDSGDDIVFKNCVNKGTILMRNAAMFFGNPSLDGVWSQKAAPDWGVTVENCRNEGQINGTVSAHYFVNSLTEDLSATGKSIQIENKILGAEGSGNVDISPSVVSGNTLPAENISVTQALTGFGVTVNESDKSIQIKAPEDASAVSYYVVAVSSYVNMINPNTGAVGGTDRYTLTQRVTSASAAIGLKYYGVADAGYGSEGTPVTAGRTQYATRTDGTNTYYSIKPLGEGELIDGAYNYYAGSYGTAAARGPAFLTVTAYDASGKVVAIANY